MLAAGGQGRHILLIGGISPYFFGLSTGPTTELLATRRLVIIHLKPQMVSVFWVPDSGYSLVLPTDWAETTQTRDMGLELTRCHFVLLSLSRLWRDVYCDEHFLLTKKDLEINY